MATILKVKTVRHLLHGKQVKAGTPGAVKTESLSKNYYAQGVRGWPAGKRVPLSPDKTVSRRMLAKLEADAERGIVNLPASDLHRSRLLGMIDEFRADLELGLASKSRTRRRPSAKQVRTVAQRVRDAITACGLTVVGDLNDSAATRLARYLNERVAVPRKAGGLSHQTAQFVLAAMKRFARWLSVNKRCPVRAEVFDTVPGFDPKNERVHPRSAFTLEEQALLLDATLGSSRVYKGLTGADRVAIYRTALSTGFRASELASLTPGSFDLAADPPAVLLSGKHAKNKKAVRQFLPAAVAAHLAGYLADKPSGRPVWPGRWAERGARMIIGDLKIAGVRYTAEEDGEVKYRDFHATRHTYITSLTANGVGPREFMQLARHSDPRLTIAVYSHTRPEQLASAVAKLPTAGASNTPSPFAHLTREQLETALAEAQAELKALQATNLNKRPPVSVALPVAPTAAPTGDNLRLAETIAVETVTAPGRGVP